MNQYLFELFLLSFARGSFFLAPSYLITFFINLCEETRVGCLSTDSLSLKWRRLVLNSEKVQSNRKLNLDSKYLHKILRSPSANILESQQNN
jgi:hypothetical protein